MEEQLSTDLEMAQRHLNVGVFDDQPLAKKHIAYLIGEVEELKATIKMAHREINDTGRRVSFTGKYDPYEALAALEKKETT